MIKPSGVITAIITPFSEKQQVDEKGIESVVEHVLSGGVDGLFILGTTGMGPTLSVEERMKVAEVVVTTVGKQCFKIIHVGGLNPTDVMKLAEHASTIGADAVAALTPFYYRLTTRELVSYYKQLEQSTNLPVLIYNIPQNTGYNITPSVTFEVVKENSRVIGMKDSSGDLSQLIATKNLLAGYGFAVLNGSDELVLPSLAVGLDGSVTALSNVIPREIKEIDTAYKNGNLRRAFELQRKVWKLLEITKHNLIPVIHAILNGLGVRAGIPHKPLNPISEAEAHNILQQFKEQDII